MVACMIPGGLCPPDAPVGHEAPGAPYPGPLGHLGPGAHLGGLGGGAPPGTQGGGSYNPASAVIPFMGRLLLGSGAAQALLCVALLVGRSFS